MHWRGDRKRALWTSFGGLLVVMTWTVGARAQVEGFDPDAGQPFVIVDPCEGDEWADPAEGEGCEQTGEYITVFSGAPRYRGNLYEITEESQLTEFCMQFNIPNGNQVTMYFNVYESVDGQQDLYRKIKEVVRVITGQGQAVFYCSGAFKNQNNQPAPVLLVAGKKYYVGCAWGAGNTVNYGRDSRTYPRPFSVGNTLGLTGGSLAPPLPDDLTLIAASSGAYSIKLCIRQQGTCCVQQQGRWECTQEFEEDCTGQFTAAGVSCQEMLAYWPAGCPLPTGACCFGQGCIDGINQFRCEALGGTYLGHYTTCDRNCVQGACCFNDGSCADALTPSECAARGGTFRGEDTSCATVFPQCGRGACCRKEGCVDDVTRTLCTSIRGTWRGEGTACADLDPHCPGACCWNFGCDVLSPQDCEQLPGHRFYGYGKVCNDFPSPCSEEAQYGACCLPDGRCFFTSDFTCDHLGGAFHPNEQCSQTNCPSQACCFDDGRPCVETDVFHCESMGGTPMGGGSRCDLVECESGLQACCFFNQSCSELPRGLCLLNGGVPLGVGTRCASSDCGALTACCLGDGSCTQLAPFDCLNQGGVPRDAGVSCANAQCNIRHPACCFDNGTCQDLPEVECYQQGGRPKSVGVSCSMGDVCTINCAKVNSLSGKCKLKGGSFMFKAVAKTTLPAGTEIVMRLDGRNPRTGTVNVRGKAVAKWGDVSAGQHTACIEDCPLRCVTKNCGP